VSAVLGGNGGTLTLTQTGTEVTAQYSGDTALEGTLRFQATSANSAIALTDQSLATPCYSTTGSTQPAETLPVTAASLLVDGTTLLLTFAGTMGAETSCHGAQVAAGVSCSRQ
jgi:hypothetical protein